MATARKQLLNEILVLMRAAFAVAANYQIHNVLAKYRVQAKPENNLAEGITAREALASSIEVLWKNRPASLEEQVENLIDQFRMQFKQPQKSEDDSDNKPATIKNASKAKKAARAEVVDIATKPTKEGKKAAKQILPLAGGPKRNAHMRGECPKCHSKGVVLAHSFSGDDYYSCIYCGFQGFRPSSNGELEVPLAQELLGRTFEEKDGV